MKKVCALSILLALVFFCGNASAATFTFSDSELQQIFEINTGTPWQNKNSPYGTGSNPVTFSGTFSGSGWNNILLGDEWGPNDGSGMAFMGWLDLSACDTFALTFKNTGNKNLGIQLFFNTGYVDSGIPNALNQDNWVWIAQGETKTISWDISSIANREQITAIGFQLGGDGTGDWQVEVSSVPIPGAVWLLGSGLLGLLGYKRKKRS